MAQTIEEILNKASILQWEELRVYQTNCEKVFVAETPFGGFTIDQWLYACEKEQYTLNYEDEGVTLPFRSLTEAKEYAKNIYKNRLKELITV